MLSRITHASSAKSHCTNQDYSPCLTRSRYQGHWITGRSCRMNIAEMFRLQGMDHTQFRIAVPDASLGQQIGNAMRVNVLEGIKVSAMKASGSISSQGQP